MLRFVLCAVAVTACTGPEPEHFLWSVDAQSLDNPFPDARLLTATGTALRPQFYQPFLMRKALTKSLKDFFDAYVPDARDHLVGMGNFTPILLRTSVPVDPASLPGHFARLKKTATGWELLEADLVPEHVTSNFEGTGVEVPAELPEYTLVRPSVPLAENTEGLFVVKRGVKTKAGDELGRGREWDKNRDLDLKPVAAALGISESDIVLALPLKAGPATADQRKLKAWVDSPAGLATVTIPAKGTVSDPSTRPVGVWKSTDADWSTMVRWIEKSTWARPATHVGQVIIGELAAKDPREEGSWKAEWVDDPSLAPTVPMHFVVTLPTGPKPASGWPVVIGAHGVGGRNVPQNNDGDSFCLEFSEPLAAAGMACIGIDAPSHGLRGSIFGFFEVEHPRVMRENFREMTFDLLQLTRAIPVMDVDGDSTPDFAPDIGYFGNSLGGMMGAAYIGFDDRISFAALNVPGGGLSNIMVSYDIRDRIGLLIVAKTSLTFATAEYYTTFPIFRAMAQPFLEAGDPQNLIGEMPHERALLIQMGQGDLTVPNFTTRSLAKSAQLDEPTAPLSGTTPLRAFTVIDPVHFLPPSQLVGYNGHAVLNDIAFSRTQIVDFLQSKGTRLSLP